MRDDPTSGGVFLPLTADIQEGLVAACNDLDRLRDLLDDACESLIAIFHAAAARADALTAGAAAGTGDAGVDGDRELATLRRDLRTAITSLQFHDLGVQLIAHTRQRLQNCADRLAQDAFGADDDDAAVAALPVRANPVTCGEMDAGSVELFG